MTGKIAIALIISDHQNHIGAFSCLRGNRKKGSFAQKKKELNEIEDLKSSGYFDKLSNRQRINIDQEYLEETTYG